MINWLIDWSIIVPLFARLIDWLDWLLIFAVEVGCDCFDFGFLSFCDFVSFSRHVSWHHSIVPQPGPPWLLCPPSARATMPPSQPHALYNVLKSWDPPSVPAGEINESHIVVRIWVSISWIDSSLDHTVMVAELWQGLLECCVVFLLQEFVYCCLCYMNYHP